LDLRLGVLHTTPECMADGLEVGANRRTSGSCSG